MDCDTAGYRGVMKPRGRTFWTAEKLAELKGLAQTMTAYELADWFEVTVQNMHVVCRRHGIVYKPAAKGGRQGKKINKQLNAQQSIELFKNEYSNNYLNILITNRWI